MTFHSITMPIRCVTIERISFTSTNHSVTNTIRSITSTIPSVTNAFHSITSTTPSVTNAFHRITSPLFFALESTFPAFSSIRSSRLPVRTTLPDIRTGISCSRITNFRFRRTNPGGRSICCSSCTPGNGRVTSPLTLFTDLFACRWPTAKGRFVWIFTY